MKFNAHQMFNKKLIIEPFENLVSKLCVCVFVLCISIEARS